MVNSTLKRACLVLSNAAMVVAWLRIILLFVTVGWSTLADDENSTACLDKLHPALLVALAVSSLEISNALIGFTRSKPLQVMLFAGTRTGVEVLLSPLMPCGTWQHLMVAFCWSLGEIVRFGCFAVDSLFPNLGNAAKSVRYTVGPIMFPIGTFGEMLMVIRAASDGRPVLYLAAALWPVGFFPLIKQLLKQRRKHFEALKKKD